MNRDGQGSTKYKHPSISESIFLRFFLLKNKTKPDFGFPLALSGGTTQLLPTDVT